MTNFTHDNAKLWTEAKTLEMMRWAQTHFGLKNFAKLAKVRVSTRYACSRVSVKYARGNGYYPRVSLNIGYQLTTKKFGEYSTIKKHPIIGDFTGDIHECITVLIAHEVAHAVDYWGIYGCRDNLIDQKGLRGFYPVRDGRHRSRGGHGVRWQMIYAILRNQFVAKGVKDPVIKEKAKKVTKNKNGQGRRRPQRQITTQRKPTTIGGRVEVSYYFYNGQLVAFGIPVRSHYGNSFRVYSTPHHKISIQHKLLIELENGRGARKWILENIVKS